MLCGVSNVKGASQVDSGATTHMCEVVKLVVHRAEQRLQLLPIDSYRSTLDTASCHTPHTKTKKNSCCEPWTRHHQ